MADFINTIDSLGDDAVIDSIINRTIPEFKDDSISNVGKYAFSKCTALLDVDCPAATVIGDYAFDGCSSLRSVNVPLLATVGRNGFSTTDIKDASFPLLTNVNVYSFANCASLEKAVLPKASSLQSQMFYGCPKLESVDVSSASWTGTEVFKGCTSLIALIVRKTDAICNMANGDILIGTPIASGTGHIYVPSALIDSYKTADNWNTYANQFRKLEEWTVDGTVTGALIDDAANKHVVHFYNSDGTLLGYTIVAAGGSAVYTGPTPVDPVGGNSFVSFAPEPTNVTADMDCYATFKDAWSDVFASIAAGTYATDYAIGDTVPLDLGADGLINMQIAAFDEDDLADGSGKAPITWISLEMLATKHQMNPAETTGVEGTGTIGGWEKCEMRAYLKDTIKPRIPLNVRNAIKEVVKTQYIDMNQGNYVYGTNTDDLWIPAIDELKSSWDKKAKYIGLFPSNNDLDKCIVGTDTVASYALRDIWQNNTKQFSYRNWRTGFAGCDPTTNLYVVLCFCT